MERERNKGGGEKKIPNKTADKTRVHIETKRERAKESCGSMIHTKFGKLTCCHPCSGAELTELNNHLMERGTDSNKREKE